MVIRWIGIACFTVGSVFVFMYLDSMTTPERLKRSGCGIYLMVCGGVGSFGAECKLRSMKSKARLTSGNGK